MNEVSKLAGVSVATVSRVLSGDPRVHPERQQRVLAAIELVGYQRNAVASSLRRADGLSNSIGLIVEDIGNPFFSAVHRGVEDVVRSRDAITLAGSSDEDIAQEQRLVAAFSARRVDGLIVVPSGQDQSYLERERAAGMRLVFLDRPPGLLHADAVLTDNVGGAAQAVAHLAALGHRRIAFIGGREPIHTAVERLRGYREGLAQQGLVEEPPLVRRNMHAADDAQAAARTLLAGPDPPTAVFTAQNLLTVGAVRAIRELGQQRVVAHVGFDDIPLGDLLEPAMTVIAQDPAALGRAAAELLFARLDGDGGPYRQVTIPTSLIVRGSGELPGPAR
jgi:LacI family transcriptional regulator